MSEQERCGIRYYPRGDTRPQCEKDISHEGACGPKDDYGLSERAFAATKRPGWRHEVEETYQLLKMTAAKLGVTLTDFQVWGIAVHITTNGAVFLPRAHGSTVAEGIGADARRAALRCGCDCTLCGAGACSHEHPPRDEENECRVCDCNEHAEGQDGICYVCSHGAWNNDGQPTPDTPA